jgi:hypothetical protein
MKISAEEIENYIKKHATGKSIARSRESVILSYTFDKKKIEAQVLGSSTYKSIIYLLNEKIAAYSCSCPYDQGDLCKHLIKVLKETSNRINSNGGNLEVEKVIENIEPGEWKASSPSFEASDHTTFILDNFDPSELSEKYIQYFSKLRVSDFTKRKYCDVREVAVNKAIFYNTTSYYDREQVSYDFNAENQQLRLSCTCRAKKDKLCVHQASALYVLPALTDLAPFFYEAERVKILQEVARDFGLEDEPNLDAYFEMTYSVYSGIEIDVKKKELVNLTTDNQKVLQNYFLPQKASFQEKEIKRTTVETEQGLVFAKNEYANALQLFYFEASLTKDGKIKNPLKEVSVVEEMEKQEDVAGIKFLSALTFFERNYYNSIPIEKQLKNIRTIFKNPLGLKTYIHNHKVSSKFTAQSIDPLSIQIPNHVYLSFDVKVKENFYEVLSHIHLNDKKINLSRLKLRYELLFEFEKTLYLVENLYYIKLFSFFKAHNFKLLIHESKFEEFKDNYLSLLEEKVEINYTFLKSASSKQLKEGGFVEEPNKTIYLTESENYIILTPSMRYGKHEIPVLSMKQINEVDADGNWYVVDRDKDLENNFIGLLLRQHEEFEEQLNQFEHFYLHKSKFYDSGWFIDAFEDWKGNNIQVLGFKELKNNKFSTLKMKVKVGISSGIDWFDTSLKVQFGNEEISLRNIQKALKNKSRFIPLGDGTQGLLPEEWIQKFEKYFRSGDLVDGVLRTSKINFSLIDELYKEEIEGSDVQFEISAIKKKIQDFKEIQDVKIPKALKATLRDYQKEGLNWLNFLDEFNFGGCLADDMGLGKTIQIISFMLSQKEKHKKATNLIVVPTSLIFNWIREVEKFAPSLKILANYGTNRSKSAAEFGKYDIVLTSYGTLISDIKVLKSFQFNYIFLDESQAIKNPDSQRFKSVKLLQARNRVVLTGTPIENNTFDLYAQFSFANPGIFGNQQRFKDEFATPIDKFKDTGRARELQQRINPFILRRTKKQVAKELPEKTEVVLYCEMGENQRKVYDTYKSEIRSMLLSKDKEEAGNKNMLLLQGLTKLRQICNSPAILSDEEDYGSDSAKLEILLEEIQSKHKSHKLLIFSQFVTMLDLIRTELDRLEISHEYLTGQTKDREEKVHRFQNDKDIRVFLISLKAGGTGLNLTEADYVYLVDPWWNPAVENQAIDRCYRIGQKKNVVAVRLITPDTIEDKILSLQASKKELAEDIIQTDANVLKSLSQRDLLQFFD